MHFIQSKKPAAAAAIDKQQATLGLGQFLYLRLGLINKKVRPPRVEQRSSAIRFNVMLKIFGYCYCCKEKRSN